MVSSEGRCEAPNKLQKDNRLDEVAAIGRGLRQGLLITYFVVW